MARRRTSGKKEVSLFPFLDILGCLIGSLILIITTVVLEQMDTRPIAEAARIDDVKLQADREQARRRTLEQRLADIDRTSNTSDARLATARARADAAARKNAEARARLAAAERIKVEKTTAPPPPDLAPLEAKRKELEAEASKLRAEIAARRKPVEQAIVVLPPNQGGGGPKRGIFVEAAKGKVIVHDPKKPWEATADKLAGDPRFKELLKSVAADKDAVITILVRPDGIGTWSAVNTAASAAGARVGRVPLPGSGRLDLTEAR